MSFTIKRNFVYPLTREALEYRNARPIYIGDDYDLEFVLTSDGETVVDITGATIKFTVKEKYSDSYIAQITGTITDATNGEFTIAIEDTTFSGTDLIRGYYDIEITISGKVETIVSGDIEILQGVT